MLGLHSAALHVSVVGAFAIDDIDDSDEHRRAGFPASGGVGSGLIRAPRVILSLCSYNHLPLPYEVSHEHQARHHVLQAAPSLRSPTTTMTAVYILAIVAKVRDCNWFCDFVLTLRSMQNNVQRYVAGLCPTSRPCMLCLQSPKVFLMATGM